MRIPGLKHLRQSARWLRSRFVRHGLILGYHRVSKVVRDPYSMCVSPQHFAEQLEVLIEQTCPISLSELVKGLQAGRLPKRAVVITFDDGYADMFYEARPLLEQYQMPATFFITTGYPGREFWWDELKRTVSTAPDLPDRLPLIIEDEVEMWHGIDIPDTRRRFLWLLYKKLLPLSAANREQVMAQIREWGGGAAVAPGGGHRAMTPAELIELADSELATIGAHTVTHPLLPVLPVADQMEEIQQSKGYLESVLGRPVRCFSYPNGSASEETETIVRDAGFMCACTSYNDVVWVRTNRYQLPRFWVPDWDGARFAGWLRRWLN